MNEYSFKDWTDATAELPWGVQKVMHDTLTLVSESKVTLAYGADYSKGSPCLVNAVAQMTQAGGGNGTPMAYFASLVGQFDRINQWLYKEGVNEEPNIVSPLAAEILLRHFAPLKEQPLEKAVDEAIEPAAFETGTYREPTDEELTRDWLNCLNVEAPACEVNPVDESVHPRVPNQA